MKTLDDQSLIDVRKNRTQLESGKQINIGDVYSASMAAQGGILITDTTAITGEFSMMVVLTDSIFTTLTTNFTKNGTMTASVAADWGTLPAGFVIAGHITAVTLTSGKVLLIK